MSAQSKTSFKSRKPKKPEAIGPNGTVVQKRRLRLETGGPVAVHKVRCRTGTFEWRYGARGNAQYHAGIAFARLWERAGIADCGSGIPRLDAVRGGGRPSLTDERVGALDEVRRIGAGIGGPMQRRLVAYCVEGRTPKEIAATYRDQVTDRQVSDTLDLDLIELAKEMGFSA